MSFYATLFYVCLAKECVLSWNSYLEKEKLNVSQVFLKMVAVFYIEGLYTALETGINDKTWLCITLFTLGLIRLSAD